MLEELLSRRALVTATPAAVALATLPALATIAPRLDSKLLALGAHLETVHADRLVFVATQPDADEDPFYEPHWQLREAIGEIPAATTAGVVIKARAAQMALHYDPRGECEGEGSFLDLSRLLIEDLLRIAAKGGLNA